MDKFHPALARKSNDSPRYENIRGQVVWELCSWDKRPAFADRLGRHLLRQKDRRALRAGFPGIASALHWLLRIQRGPPDSSGNILRCLGIGYDKGNRSARLYLLISSSCFYYNEFLTEVVELTTTKFVGKIVASQKVRRLGSIMVDLWTITKICFLGEVYPRASSQLRDMCSDHTGGAGFY